MNVLQAIIGAMGKEELRNYKLFANRTQLNETRKDIELFDHIRKTYPEYNEELINNKLYGGVSKNSIYRLKNRLLEDVSKSQTLIHFDELDFNKTLYFLALCKLYAQKRILQVSFYYLGKAEKIALKNEFFELLDLVYAEFIRLSLEAQEINPEVYVEKRKANRVNVKRVQQIDDILAVLMYRIRTSQLFGKSQDQEILKLLEATVEEFSSDDRIKKSKALRFRLYHALSRILLQREDFVSLEQYLVKTYNEFIQEHLFDKENHDTKLQMLTYLTNAFYKNQKLEESLHYAELLKEAMLEHDGMLYDKYLFFYYNALVINSADRDLDHAISVLEEAIKSPVIRKNPLQVAFIYLNFSVAYFEKGEFKIALRNIAKLMMEDSFKKLDEAFVLKVYVAELICRYETEDHEFIELRVKQIIKDHPEAIRSEQLARDMNMILLLGDMVKTGKRIKKKLNLPERINNYIQKYEEAQTNDLIDYDDWLRKKLKQVVPT